MNYYEILGLLPSAGMNDIKRAYRRLAVTYHPDKNKDPAAEDFFKLVNEAYEVLSDPARKQTYDQRLQNPLIDSVQSTPRHRDPAYRPGPKAYRKSEGERVRELMVQYLPYTRKVSLFCFVLTLALFVDFLWPKRTTQENIENVSTRRTYSRNSSTTWWVIHTSNGNAIDIPFELSEFYQVGEQVRVQSSYFFNVPIRVDARNHEERINKTIYGNFIFAPIALLVISGLGVLLRSNVDYGFNLGVTSFVILLFLIIIILVI